MRLQLGMLFALGRMASADPIDEPGVSAGLHVYADDDHVTVVSPSASVRTDLTSDVSLSADTTVDAVSAASVDVVTSASPSTVHEQRVELGLSSTYREERTRSWTAGVRASHEHDYDSLRLRASGRWELAQRNTMLQLDYVFGYDDVASMMDRSFHRDRRSHELMSSVSQLLNRRSVLDVVVDVTRADGYHASPYRWILVDMPASPLPMRLDEVTPQLRTSVAIAMRLRYAATDSTTTSAMYRFYDDTWAMRSHTVTAEVLRTVGDWLMGGTLRGYVQSDASFYAARYIGEPRYRTHDRTLGAMRSVYAAATLDAPLGSWHVIASAGVLQFWFLDFPAQSDRRAVLVFSSVTKTW
jgi:hypothetical protein